MSQLAFGLGIF